MHTCVHVGAAQVVHYGAHGGLAGEAGHAVDAAVDDVGAGRGAGDLCGDARAGGVVGVHVDGGVGEAGSQGAHLSTNRLTFNNHNKATLNRNLSLAQF
jgi:hypothetical protein